VVTERVPESAYHRAQLLEVTPELMSELLALEKIEVINPDKLPFGEFTELESALLFGGRPIRFLQHADDIYLWDSAEQVGGLEEYAYLTRLLGTGVNTRDYLAAAIGRQAARRKKLLEYCQQVTGQRQTHMNARKQMQVRAQNEKVRNKIEDMACIILNESIDTVKVPVKIRPQKTPKKPVVRIKPSEEVVQIYCAENEIEQDSTAEQEMAVPAAERRQEQETVTNMEIQPENHLEFRKKKAIIDASQRKQKGEAENAKSNSKGIEKS